MWYYYRIIDSNGFVSRRIRQTCLRVACNVFGFAVIKDGQIIIDFCKAMDAWKKENDIIH